MANEKESVTPVPKLDLTIGGGATKIRPWWNMRAIRKLKEEHNVKVSDVLKDVFDVDKVVPFYLVGLDAREPGKYTIDMLLDQLDMVDMLKLQAEMTNIARAFGLDVAVPLTNPTDQNGETTGQSASSTAALATNNSGS